MAEETIESLMAQVNPESVQTDEVVAPTIYEDILSLIEECEYNFSLINVYAQKYIDLHEDYLERKIKDSRVIKNRMKEKIVRVINEDR